MTILSVIQEATARLSLARPESVFSSTVREHVELADVANDMADWIATHHDWSVLKRLYTITGNGETDGFDLPEDYDRMPKDQGIWSSELNCTMEGPVPHDVWLGRLTQGVEVGLGSWTLLGGQFVFEPVITDGETATLYYQSNLHTLDDVDEPKASFTADTDVFRLDERLLRLAIIYKWRSNKGLASEMDGGEFMKLLAERVERDRGSRVIRVGRAGMPRGVRLAYPRTIVV